MLIAALVLSCCQSVAGATDAAGRDDLPRVKAAIIYNICKFVEWPPAGAGEFVIGVFGRNEDGPDLAILEGKQIHARAVRIVDVVNASDLVACHAAYVGEPGLAAEAWSFLDGLPVLTFGDRGASDAPAGMIELVHDSDRLRFDVHKAPAARTGLQFSSQLLKLARSVTDE